MQKIASLLLVIGGLNWGLVAFDYNLVEMLLGTYPSLVKTVYILVGLSAVVALMGSKSESSNSQPMM